MIEIREAAKDDISAIMVIEEACFNDPWSMESIIEEIDYKNGMFLVAIMGDELVGYGALRTIFDEGHITNIATHKFYQRQGIGTKLLEGLIRKSNLIDVVKFTLEVRESNVSAIKMYEKLGFKIAGKRKRYYFNPVEDGIIMWRE